MPDPSPSAAARLVTLQTALLRTALAAPAGSRLRADLTSAAQWAVWAGGCRPGPITRGALASLLDATNRLIADTGFAPALRNVGTTLADVLDRFDQPDPTPEPGEAA